MYKLIFIVILVVMIFSCCTTNEKNDLNSSSINPLQDGIVLKKFVGLSITGDFDGDGKLDTLSQRIGSKYKHIEFDSLVDPARNHRDVVTNWHFNRGTDLYITSSMSEVEALHLGSSQGLYCLINLGDNNSDRSDEIAFVPDLIDVSNVNSCKIVSICEGKWKLLKEFAVDEASFKHSDNKPKVFSEIKNHLEFKDKTWFYKDYFSSEFATGDTLAKMQKLKIDKCK